jgi:hypothetical protein
MDASYCEQHVDCWGIVCGRRVDPIHEKYSFRCLTEAGHHQMPYATSTKYPQARDILD